jgi:hypothetical protein
VKDIKKSPPLHKYVIEETIKDGELIKTN